MMNDEESGEGNYIKKSQSIVQFLNLNQFSDSDSLIEEVAKPIA